MRRSAARDAMLQNMEEKNNEAKYDRPKTSNFMSRGEAYGNAIMKYKARVRL